MGKTEKHHRSQKAIQRELFGGIIDDTTIDLPIRYHREVINPLQRKGVGDAFLAGRIDHDFITGQVFEYEDEGSED